MKLQLLLLSITLAVVSAGSGYYRRPGYKPYSRPGYTGGSRLSFPIRTGYGGRRPGYGGGIKPYGGGVAPHGGGIAPYGGGVAPHGGGVAPHGGGVAPHGGGVAPYGGGVAPHAGGVAPHAGKGNQLATVINVNNNYGYGPYQAWKVDCSKTGAPGADRWISAIWDDSNYKNFFSDLDYVKCDGGYGYQPKYGPGHKYEYDTVIIPLYKDQAYDYEEATFNCPEYGNYVLTGFYDPKVGFPDFPKAKCTKLNYNYVDLAHATTIYTKGKTNGPYTPYDLWNVDCGKGYAAVGVKIFRGYDKGKYYQSQYGFPNTRKIIGLNCAPVKPH